MTLEYALKENGIDPEKVVNVDTSVDFAAMGGAFIGGQGDFVTLFEPNALELEKEGYGYVVASVGELGGVVPYTSYSARISFLEENKELITNFTKAIQKGLELRTQSFRRRSRKSNYQSISRHFPRRYC